MPEDILANFPLSRRAFLAAMGATAWALTHGCTEGPASRTPELSGTPTDSVPLAGGWLLQSSEVAHDPGDILSLPAANVGGWYKVTVPCTVLAGLVANGEYPDLFTGDNLKKVPKARFKSSWWYRREFPTPQDAPRNQTWLYFKGINYRANIFLNGQKIADAKTVVGTYRDFELNITPYLAPEGTANVLAVEVFQPQKGDPAITFVDWAPAPPDLNMGLWQDVELRTSGPVAIRYPFVQTDPDLPSLQSAAISVYADVTNATNQPVSAVIRAQIESISLSQTVALAPHETKTIAFTPDTHPELKVANPRIWWPWQLGKPEMYQLSLTASVGGAESDRTAISFGIRKVTSRLDDGHCLFTVNGVDLLVLGGGYAPDLLQRRAPADRPSYQEDHVRYTRDMHLNTIRLEGKLEDDAFYSLCDHYGILVMAGWCCCSPWEQWKSWKQEQHTVALESLRYQIRRARSHPSLLVWLNGSDNHPPGDVEKEYLAIEADLKWPCPTLSSATAKEAASGPTGVKMEGPYKWEPPIYWLTDKTKGGAWGFNTEVGPGAVPPPLESLEKMFPPDHRWPMDDVWNYHGGGGTFGKITDFTDALDARFGKPKNLRDFAWKSQAQAYETIRAMYEGFRRNKFNSGGGATGEIQWMLNNAWPSLIWHLYDYYFRPGGAYFATKIACEPLHILYSYDNNSIVVANDTLDAAANLTATADIYDIHSKPRGSQTKTFDSAPNASTALFTLQIPPDISTAYFVRLTLYTSAGKVLSVNSYFLSTKPDVLVFGKEEKDDWNITPCSSYADFTQLDALPRVKLSVTQPAITHDGDEDEARARVKNESDGIALLVRVKLSKDGGEEILPIRWEDNYFMLLPGEQREVAARYLASDAGTPAPTLSVGCFNNGRD